MSKKHLTLSDRIIVQTGLQQHLSLAATAEKAGVSRSTVSREIKARRKPVKTSKGNNCIHRDSCTRIPDCCSACFHGKRSARVYVEAVTKAVESIRKSSALITSRHPIPVMDVTGV